jgi:hypothetical protein
MDKNHLPISFGVFKPVGHVVMALRSDSDLQAARQALQAQGFEAADLVAYTPREMIDQVDAEVPNASVLAGVGQELNLILAHRALALGGCSFLVVATPHQAQIDSATTVARGVPAVAAQHYGHFIIEELIDDPSGNTEQRFESPDRGLDLPVAGHSNR